MLCLVREQQPRTKSVTASTPFYRLASGVAVSTRPASPHKKVQRLEYSWYLGCDATTSGLAMPNWEFEVFVER